MIGKHSVNRGTHLAPNFLLMTSKRKEDAFSSGLVRETAKTFNEKPLSREEGSLQTNLVCTGGEEARPGEMAQRLRALVALLEDLGSILSTLRADHNHL